ncbi:M24 family metallopeptidase [Sulfobacillus harzensis]|uniref:Aminopeptidase P family protein n=1 Tax=Sulfobacillus harzensis TaxID=2729629 RepID=A0A7Y0Q2C6_9FIRM|nr:Xaa-Pro peptidase family protein [Sulfobacillus harzensis]NMP23058.1 aminopeptidase P family protein [Sulfobacillus harzensis]
MTVAHWNRLQAVLADKGLDAVFIAAPEQLSSVNLHYLTGFTGSSAFLLVSRDQAWLLTDFRYLEQAAAQCPDIEVVQHGRVSDTLRDLVVAHQLWHLGFESDKVPVAMWEAWKSRVPAVWHRVPRLVEELRVHKSADELQKIRRAAAIAGDAVRMVLSQLPGQREDAVARAIEWEMRRQGAVLGFSTIVASGPRGALPHAQPSERVIQSGDLVTIDFGAEFQGYKSDETITVGVGSVPDQLREIFAIVEEAQKAGIAVARPGNSTYDVDRAARQIIEKAGYGENFGHGTGHGVGLEVHEDPFTVQRPDQARTLEPGMTLTVEPGIYVPGLGGVRLEDTLVITETGNERLTLLPKHYQSV